MRQKALGKGGHTIVQACLSPSPLPQTAALTVIALVVTARCPSVVGTRFVVVVVMVDRAESQPHPMRANGPPPSPFPPFPPFPGPRPNVPHY